MAKSIITQISEFCFLCGRRATEVHHIYGGANRGLSEKYGLTVPLCHACHNEPPHGAHHNKETADMLKAIGQVRFEQEYPNLDFREIFGKNYR